MDRMREEFEAWVDGLSCEEIDAICEKTAWITWQASRQALIVELPDSWDSNIGISSYSDSVHDALDKAGIKWTE